MKQILHPIRPVLIVDDDEVSLRLTNAFLKKAGLNNILPCQDSRRALELLDQRQVGIVFLDLVMPGVSGETLLRAISQEYPGTLAVILTGTEDIDTAVRCIKEGAFDYITKPLEFGRLSTVVKNALAFQDLQQENLALKQRVVAHGLGRPDVFAGIVTHNPQMHLLFQYAEAIARTAEPVLITGETGVGKDLLAQAIHVLSGRRGSLVAVNVAGLDDNVFSDTLFGHAKGAFTGAERARAGLVEQAAGGTLFLDEIGDLALASQAKLLRLLQEGDYFPLGQDRPKRGAARIVSATNRDLWQLVKQGVFRKDLNFRLRTHHLHLPPLRERLDDLPLLVDHFLARAAAQLNKPKPRVGEKLLTLLGIYSFPGNVRELHTMVFDAASRTTDKFLSIEPFKRYISQQQGERLGTAASLSSEPNFEETAPLNSSDETDLIRFAATLPTLRQATELLIKEALRRCKGKQSAAARLLGISQQAVSKRLKSL
ncbi:MAG TPA: sigma-54-dependent Fis family transcriptional regulator [Xanthomonadaceae bacterium]|nr:sigma-54-dependent Fis family transcriptional regulator [Xanthomonadaceae bacterium]